MKTIYSPLLIGIFLVSTLTNMHAQLTPQQAILHMGRGINLGNSLDAVPTETSWGNEPIQEYYFQDYKEAGFKSVRIPITWKYHVSAISPYTIDSVWLDRVDTVVSWALSKGLFVTINAHHEDGLKSVDTITNSIAREDTLAKYDSIWSQVATRFKDRSDSLLFEILNEPQEMEQSTLDSLNKRILSIIRKTNPTRIVLFSGTSYTGSYNLEQTAIPDTTDPYLIGYYHSYDPWEFAGEAQGTFGSNSDRNNSENRFIQVSDWSRDHNIPVTLNECGAIKACDYNSRMIYYSTFVEQALKYKVAFYVWDDNDNFQTFKRNTRTWDDVKDVIIHTYPTSPTKLRFEVGEDSSAVLLWVNRTTKNDSIVVEKREGGVFNKFTTLAPDADSVLLPNIEKDIFHYYRLKTTINDTLMYSYPMRLKIASSTEIYAQPNSVGKLFEIYPNPTKDFITIRTDKVVPGQRMVIYNSIGQIIDSFVLFQNEITIDLSDWRKGLYFVRAEGKGSKSFGRFMLY